MDRKVIQKLLKLACWEWASRSSARSLIRLLRSCAPLRSLVRLLAHSLAPELLEQWNIFVQFSRCSETLCSVINLDLF